jgi:dephospho-CoA kinase
MVVGLTGGMGCGKSTAGRMFEKHGFRRLDSDQIVHDLLESDPTTIREVEDVFGPKVISNNGGVNRSLLGSIVFGDDEKLQALEDIMHPKVREAWEGAVASNPEANWILEIPLLFEKNLQNRVDFTVCVFSDLLSQVERLEQKGMGRAQALARINRQMPLSQKAENADFVLLNEGSLEFLEDQIKTLLTRL